MARRRRSNLAGSHQFFTGASNKPDGVKDYDTLVVSERPSVTGDIDSIFTRCREVAKTSTFLSAYYRAKLAFYNHGFAVTLGPESKGDNAALEKWLNEDFAIKAEYKDQSSGQTTTVEINRTRGEAIRQFVRNAWMEFQLIDNVIGMWLEDGRAPAILPPEKCRYIDKLGLQIMFYTHGLSTNDIELLDPKQQKRFKDNRELLLNPDEGEHFKVLKRGLDGEGFVIPQLYPLFRTLGEIDSKEIAFHGRAHQMRAVTRHHKAGHAITQGQHAGKGTWFITKQRSNAILSTFKDRQGPHDFTSNFDHEIVFPWPDVSVFDAVAWQGTNKRLAVWGGPLAQMLVADKIIEGGLAYERTLANDDRTAMADFLRPIIRNAFNAPENLDISFAWSDLVFVDPSKATDIIKFALQQGAVSVTTAQQFLGFDPAKEDLLKVKEADDKDATKKYLPMWDSGHGISPATGQTVEALKAAGSTATGQDPGSTNGRPQGSKTTAS